jgi:hypothetical protein
MRKTNNAQKLKGRINILPLFVAVYKHEISNVKSSVQNKYKVIIMEIERFEIVLLKEDSAADGTEAYEQVFMYLLQRYCEGSEEYEGINIFESINRGTGRKGLFDAGSEDGRRE